MKSASSDARLHAFVHASMAGPILQASELS